MKRRTRPQIAPFAMDSLRFMASKTAAIPARQSFVAGTSPNAIIF